MSIADGDTITVLDSSNKQHKIRMNGIDAPESSQAFGQTSKQNLSSMVFGKTVVVEYAKTDRYGRVLGRVLLDGKDVNLEQLKAGCAWFYKQYEKDIEEARRKPYADAEAAARAARKGLWADPNPQPPWEYRHPDAAETTTTKPTPAPSASSTTSAPIIGNKNSMIYHAPNCPDYDKVSERNRVPFKSEAEAVKSGYRKARNCP